VQVDHSKSQATNNKLSPKGRGDVTLPTLNKPPKISLERLKLETLVGHVYSISLRIDKQFLKWSRSRDLFNFG